MMDRAEKIRGVNLGNWLVLERWMDPELFAGTDAEDETWLRRLLPEKTLAERLRRHRDNWVTERDFRWMKRHGINLVRIPVPYFVFGDREPYDCCLPWLDKAFSWAEETGIRILLDLHTSPGNQNGYDNGGLVGVCRWHKDPEEVEYVLTVLTRLGERYGKREALFGIEVLNEPISLVVYLTAPTTGRARDKEEARGSSHVPMRFLKKFYTEAYRRLRHVMPEEKAVIFHDGFRLRSWNRFFKKSGMENVYLDTHQYIWAMEMFLPFHRLWAYRLFTWMALRSIRKAEKAVPVIVGEWCICTRHAAFFRNHSYAGKGTDIFGTLREKLLKHDLPEHLLSDLRLRQKELQRERYRKVADMELAAWKEAAGWIYWSYKLLGSRRALRGESWKEGWDFRRCVMNGWMDSSLF